MKIVYRAGIKRSATVFCFIHCAWRTVLGFLCVCLQIDCAWPLFHVSMELHEGPGDAKSAARVQRSGNPTSDDFLQQENEQKAYSIEK